MRAVKTFLAALLLASSFGVSAASQGDFRNCPQFFVNGTVPVGAQLETLRPRALCYEAFAVLHSGTTKTPVYVAERLNRTQMLDAKGEKRHNKFFADARLPRSERAELDDYRGSGMDRGHMAPAANMPNETAMEQSFSLANIVPQDPTHNQKLWAGIEKATRKFAMRAEGNVFVITGPVFDNNSDYKQGPNGVRVPSHLFKLVYDEASGRAWAHWSENSADAQGGRPISYQELVQRTGIHFLPGINVKL